MVATKTNDLPEFRIINKSRHCGKYIKVYIFYSKCIKNMFRPGILPTQE